MSYLLKGAIEDLANLTPNDLVARMLHHAQTDDHSPAEQASWRNSLYRLIQFLQTKGMGKLYLVAEYTLLDKRIDALLFGYKKGTRQVLTTIVELKQWQALADNEQGRVTEVPVQIGHQIHYRTHPIFQTATYKRQLENHHSYFQGKTNAIQTIQYLDNFDDDKAKFFAPPYQDYCGKARERQLIIKQEAQELIACLEDWYAFPSSLDQQLINEVESFLSGHYVLGEVGLSGIKRVLNNRDNAIMLADQQEIAAQISLIFQSYQNSSQSTAIIITGDPGTGKTIIGLHLLYLAQKRGIVTKKRLLLTFAKSRMLMEVIKQESGLSLPYIDRIQARHYDVMVIDEAHRLPNPRATLQTCLADGQEKVLIFLVDDRQRIRLDERGSAQAIQEACQALGLTPHTFNLTTQQRSGYKSTYLDSIRQLLYHDPLPQQTMSGTFRVHIGSDLETIDQQLLAHQKQGQSIKWFAPYCWKWPSRLDSNQYDIIIDDFKKQWNPFTDQYDWYKGEELCHFQKVGSVYTAQGLDYDHIGLIWWSDLKWNKTKHCWDYDLTQSEDSQFRNPLLAYLKQQGNTPQAHKEALQLVLNQYYVLLTRARKSIYLWFKDQDTRDHVQHLLEDFIGKL